MRVPAEVVGPSLRGVLETMYFMGPVYRGAGVPSDPAFGAVVRFTGPCRGELRVVVKREVAARMAAELLVAEPRDVSDEHSRAAVAELANVACGALLERWMPWVDFRLAVPLPLPEAEARRSMAHCFSVEGGGPAPGLDLGVDLLLDS